MRILLGVDESPHSDAAVEFVRNMQWPAGTQVLVVSAARPLVPAYGEVYVPAAPYSEQVIEQEVQYHEQIAARAEEQIRLAGIATEARVLTGDPREVLISEARNAGVDLIV